MTTEDVYPPIIKLEADDKTAFLRAARSGNLEKVVEYLDTDLDINAANSNGLNALHLASKDGHVEIVTELLKRGAKIDAATKKGNTALHIASLAGQSEIVNILLRYGSTVNIQSQNGFTPLYMAAQENHDQVVKILLCNGANQSLATEDGFTPLAVAMQQGHDKVVSVLLENDSKGKVRLPALHIAAKKDDCKAADLLLQNDHKPDVTSKSGFTPLHIAAHYGNEEIARLLIKRGADVNYLAKHNISPLHVAAKWGKNNMVKILLENSASIDAKTRDGLTPLHCAARSGHDEVVGTLLENSAPISARTKNGLAPLHMASQGDHVDAARVLLYHRAPVDEVTIDYLTSLHVAAHCGHVRVAKLLLERKADANARALNGFTPLHIACKKNRIKVVELLIKHGASIESTTESGLTPLHVASFMGCMNIVIFLLQHEANPDVPTVRGETPLHLAARANQTDIIRILLRNGAKVDARAREQQTPLHIASRLGNVDIVMLLLQHGATVDTTTKDMYTALHIAAKEGQEEVAAILVENNASTKAATKNGFTPLHIAAKYGNINVAKILLQKDSATDAQGKNEITALHMACHYDHPSVATLLLDKGASPHVASQNGHTPLHTAARKNQMDIASTLLEHGADANVESKAGFTPLHLSAQKGHYDMTNLLIEHGANPNHKAKNGLTALHLCAQEDSIRVASILVKNGADVESQTETGYRPIHVASHFGNLSMIRFLLKHNAEIDVKNQQNYTPLHQAAQQGHAHVASALLDGNASHKARTSDGLTALNIAQKLGYISVMEVLKGLSYDNLAPNNKNWEDKYKVIAPESLQEANFMSDSDDEGGSDTLINEQPYRYLTADLMKSLRDDSLPIDVTRDDPIHKQMSKEDRQEFVQSSNYCSAENFEMQDSITLGRMHLRSFLVSFLVDARGGAMKGCRHSGIRIIVPPRRATMPIRVTCRLVKPSKIINPPPLMEGEALATRIIEMGPVAATFLGPVLIDVPHFASARGKEREMIILRSENGENWKEHDNSLDNDDTLANTPQDPQMSAAYSGRITRIITTDFPQYFAIITRIKQEVHVIGADGGILMSSVVDHVQAVFPPGALTKKIKVGLQAHVIPAELTAKLLGNCVAVSPVITIEPRRRKFHKPITLTIPVPQAANKGMINQYGGETPTLRLLCSIAGGTSEAQWEDVTGSTPLTFLNDERVSFTTTVSARFWLMDCRNIGEVPKMATELYKESLFVPFITNFVIYSKRMDLLEATLRILCMTEGKEGLHTLERQEEFLEIVKSRDVEALDGKDLYIEFSGNLVPVTKSGVQLKFTFKAFRQNRLSFHVKVKDPLLDPVARMLFMREPKVPKGEAPQQPICILNIVLPEIMQTLRSMENRSDFQDSNIITQKMDIFMSNREAEGTEKSDDPKIVTSPMGDFGKASMLEDREDAAIIHESFAQKVACPIESVDASYPNKLDARDDSPSPVAEKQTYSEKRKFWEDITKKRDNLERSESEVSRTSQLTINESDSECAQTVPSEEDTSGRSDTMEDMNIPDISECSVAEKAHYFEEQIQREMTQVKTIGGKPSAVEEMGREAAAGSRPEAPIAEERAEAERRTSLDKNVVSSVGKSVKVQLPKEASQIPVKVEARVDAKPKMGAELSEEGISVAAAEEKVKRIREEFESRIGSETNAEKTIVEIKSIQGEKEEQREKQQGEAASEKVEEKATRAEEVAVKLKTVESARRDINECREFLEQEISNASEPPIRVQGESVKAIKMEFESRIPKHTVTLKNEKEAKSKKELELKQKTEVEEKERAEKELELKQKAELEEKERVKKELELKQKAELEEKERVKKELELKQKAELEEKERVKKELELKQKAELEEKERVRKELELKQKAELEEKERVKKELELKQKAELEEKERVRKELELKQKAELEEKERVKKELELKQKAELEEKERVRKELELKQKAELEEKERVKKELELKQKAELEEKERVRKELELKEKAELEEKERVKRELELKQKAELEEKERVRKELELKQKAELEEKERVKKELELKQKAELEEKERVKKELELKQKAELEEKERVRKELELKEKAELEEKERVKKELELKQKAELEERERVRKELELKQKAELEEKERVKRELELKEKAELEEKERVRKELELKEKAELEEKERVKRELELKQKAELEEKERVKKELELKQKLEEKEKLKTETIVGSSAKIASDGLSEKERHLKLKETMPSKIPVTHDQKTHAAPGSSAKEELKSPETVEKRKETESRIPKRITESVKTETEVTRHEDDFKAHSDRLQELKTNLTGIESAKKSASDTSFGRNFHAVKQSFASSETTRTEKTSTEGFSGKFPHTEPSEGFKLFEKMTGHGDQDVTTTTTKSIIDHKVSSRKEAREILSSETTTKDGTRIELSEREHSEEKDTERKESKMTQILPTQKIQESKSEIKDLESTSDNLTSLKMQDEEAEIAASVSRSKLEKRGEQVLKSQEDKYGVSTDESSFEIVKGIDASASLEMRADLSELMGRHEPFFGAEERFDVGGGSQEEFRAKHDDESKKGSGDFDNARDELAKKCEARNIAETIIQSIEAEIETRSMASGGYGRGIMTPVKEETKKEHRKSADFTKSLEAMGLEDVGADFDDGKLLLLGTKRESLQESISISEDLTKDEESSGNDRDASFAMDSSGLKTNERDIMVSPSTISDQTEMEDSMEVETSMVDDAKASITNDRRESRSSVGQRSSIDFDPDVRLEARILEIIEPVDLYARQGSLDTESMEQSSWAGNSLKRQDMAMSLENAPLDSFGRLYPERDITISPSTVSEQTDIEDSLIHDPTRKYYDMVVTRHEDSFEMESPPLVCSKTSIKSLDIKPVNWMIGDEKIEISESVQPSQAFSQELDEYESIIKQESIESVKVDSESGEEGSGSVRVTISSGVAASESRGMNVISETQKTSKFTVIPVSDKQLESELVENNLDVSCQELMETLQKEFDAKTPTENFVFGTAQSVVRDSVHDGTRGERSKPEEPSTELSKISPKLGESMTESKNLSAEGKTKVEESKTGGEKMEEGFRFGGSEEVARKGDSSREESIVEQKWESELREKHAETDVPASMKSSSSKEEESSVPYDITVLDQAVRKEIAEVKESLEAAKQDLIEELNEHSEAIIQIKDSPSEFQFKLQSDSIPNDLPLLYKSEPGGVTSSPIAKPRKMQEDPSVAIPADHAALDSSVVASAAKVGEESVVETEVRPIFEKCQVPRRVADAEPKDSSATDLSAPVPASRSSSDLENKDEASAMLPPQPAPRRRHKPARTPKKAKHEADPDVNSSSGESNYQSCDYEIGSGSRPSSSDFEAMLAGIPSGTASEYDTALTSADHSSFSRPTSQDYHTAISSLSSRESMKSLNSESSGHLASIESSSEISETLVASEAEIDGDQLDDGTDYVLDEEFQSGILATSRSFETAKTVATDEDASGGLQASETAPCRMKRSSEMIFQQLDELGTENASKSSPDDKLDLKLKTSSDNATSTLHAGDSPGAVQSVDLMTSRVETDGVQSVCTQVTSREDPPLVDDSKTDDRRKLDRADDGLPEPESVEPKLKSLSGNEGSDVGARYEDLILVQQTSMSTSSTSGMSIETVIDKDKQDRKSPDSDSFELVDKPDIIDDFVVIEEVGREAEEFDTEGKSIHITGMAGTSKKLYDREVENLIGEKKDDAQVSSSQASRHNELFDFESEESPPQLSNEDQYSQSYSDEEQYEGSKKWVEMQFQPDTRGYELDYDRGPLEDIKEEEITDFEPGSSRFGSLGSHKESIGSIGSMKGSLGSTPDYDVLAGRKYFTKPSEHDNLSLSSLQEFENLETAMAMENARRLQCGSQDSVNGSLPRRYLAGRSGHGDDISLSSLKDFEGLEKACTEAHMIELRAREEEDLLDHESPENRYKLENLVRSKSEISAPASFNPSTSGSDDYEKRIREIDEIIRIAQSNVEKFDRQDDTTDDISQIEVTDTEKGLTSGQPAASGDADPQIHYAEANVMETSTDSLELEDVDDKKNNPLCRSSDSLEMKTTMDIPSLSSDSLNNARDSREGHLDNADQFNNSRRLSSDSLEIPFTENHANIPVQHYESNSNYPERQQQVDNAVPRTSAPGASLPQSISMKKSSSKNGT